MKAQEAIEALKLINLTRVHPFYDWEEMKDVRDMAISALEKQIPKRPNYEADGYADGVLVYDTAYCPVCNHTFEEGINEWGSDYCQDCGQALDWSEESEETE